MDFIADVKCIRNKQQMNMAMIQSRQFQNRKKVGFHEISKETIEHSFTNYL